MAKSKGMSWFFGCLIGCGGLAVLGVVVVGGGGWLLMRDTMGGFKQAVETRDELEREFGDVDDFVPPADGAVAPERMEAFLAVREDTHAARQAIVEFFEGLPMSEAEAEELENQPLGKKLGAVFNISTSALGFGGDLGDFYKTRNEAFGRHGIGLGEYTYIYALAYYSWLGKSPDDGPGDEDDFKADVGGGSRHLRRHLRAMLGNQLQALEGQDAELSPTAAALAAELEKLEEDRRRIPWEDGLPAAIAASFEPFRERLEASYVAAANPFELSRIRQQGRFSVTTE